MVRERSVAWAIVLYFVTCGISGLFWMASLANDVNAISGEYKTSGGMVVLLSIVTCGIYTWVWLYRCGERLDAAGGKSRGNLGIVYLLLSLFGLGIVAYALMQDEINRFAR